MYVNITNFIIGLDHIQYCNQLVTTINSSAHQSHLLRDIRYWEYVRFIRRIPPINIYRSYHELAQLFPNTALFFHFLHIVLVDVSNFSENGSTVLISLELYMLLSVPYSHILSLLQTSPLRQSFAMLYIFHFIFLTHHFSLMSLFRASVGDHSRQPQITVALKLASTL